jgi:hypothetical protein
MTRPASDVPSRRLGDHGWWSRVRSWWWTWGQPVFGAIVIAVAVAVFIVALQVRSISIQRAHDEAATAKAARQACERAKALGPALAADYEQRDVLSGENLALYRSLIPKNCPARP